MPCDVPSKTATLVGALLMLMAVLGRGASLLGLGPSPVPKRVFLSVASGAAALLSVLYIAEYLRGGPRIIDATTYFLQARAIAHGLFSFPVAPPTASFRGRFLLFHEPTSMAGIFPPGFPLLLGLGFELGAPMVVGPLLGAALVVATYRLGRTFAEEACSDLAEPVARAAALFSVFSAALRYHTADTMSHGASALGIALALDRVIVARRLPSRSSKPSEPSKVDVGLAGLALGFVVATRPVSAVPIGLVSLALMARQPCMLWRWLLGIAPGLAILLVAQHSATGSWFVSSQQMYYATSDGPPDCFRYGFGSSVGCLHEHGDVIAARERPGYWLVDALVTTLRRLRLHGRDVLNFEPLSLLLLVAVRGRRTSGRAAAAVVLLQALIYAPFYFEGSYPGGGARLLADVIPIEHAMMAVGLAVLAGEGSRMVRVTTALLAAALWGFGLHAVFGHIQLRDRDGGRPMFEPDELARRNITHGIVYVDTDHGFNVGFDPTARAHRAVVVARLRNDDRDRLLYDSLHQPPSWLYHFDPASKKVPTDPTITLWTPPPSGDTHRFEAEAEWPPLLQRGGYAEPRPVACASQSSALVLIPTLDEKAHVDVAHVEIEVPVPENGTWRVQPAIVHGSAPPSTARGPFSSARSDAGPRGGLRMAGVEWVWGDNHGGACVDLPSHDVELHAPSVRVVFEASRGPMSLDKISLRRVR